MIRLSFVPNRCRNFREQCSVILPRDCWLDLLKIQIEILDCRRSSRCICENRMLPCREPLSLCAQRTSCRLLPVKRSATPLAAQTTDHKPQVYIPEDI